MKLKTSAAPLSLVKGQLWKTDKGHVEIMEVGKILTQYRLFQNQKRVPTTMGRIEMVRDYLKKNQGKLVKKLAPRQSQGLR